MPSPEIDLGEGNRASIEKGKLLIEDDAGSLIIAKREPALRLAEFINTNLANPEEKS
jgi:hypothetical protein